VTSFKLSWTPPSRLLSILSILFQKRNIFVVSGKPVFRSFLFTLRLLFSGQSRGLATESKRALRRMIDEFYGFRYSLSKLASSITLRSSCDETPLACANPSQQCRGVSLTRCGGCSRLWRETKMRGMRIFLFSLANHSLSRLEPSRS